MRFQVIILLLFILAGAREVQASQAANGDPVVPGMGPDAQADCGQSCLYQKANDLIGVEAVYLLTKVEKLKNLVAVSQNQTFTIPSGNEKQLRDNLGAFCAYGTEFDRDLKKCWVAYLQRVKETLRKMRTASLKNREQINLLNSQTPAPGLPTVQEGPRPVARPRIPAVPLVPTISELEPTFRKLANDSKLFNEFANRAYQEWLEGVPHAPSPEDFMTTDQMKRNPSDPNSDFIEIPHRDAKGVPVLDAKATVKYKNAVADYQQRIELANSDFAALKTDLLNGDINGRYQSQNYQKLAAELPRPKTTQKPKDYLTQESLDAFKEARMTLVDQANQHQQQLQLRKLASAPKTTNGSTLQGTLQPQSQAQPLTGEEQVLPSTIGQGLTMHLNTPTFDAQEALLDGYIQTLGKP